MTARFLYPCIYELKSSEKCAGCGGEIGQTAYGQWTQFKLDTKTDKDYHGDCGPSNEPDAPEQREPGPYGVI